MAQNFTLSGFIKDSENGEDLIGATIQVDSLSIGTTTNTYGFYSFEIPPGEHQLSVSYLGFSTQFKRVTMEGDTKLDFAMGVAAEQLEEVVVSSTAADNNVRSAEMGVAKIPVATIQKIPVVLGEAEPTRISFFWMKPIFIMLRICWASFRYSMLRRSKMCNCTRAVFLLSMAGDCRRYWRFGSTDYKSGETIKHFDGWSPRLSARVSLNENSSIKFGYHRMYQYLHLISNTTSASPLDIWSPSGPYKAPQTADQVSVGYFRNFADNQYEFSVETYYKWLNNLSDFVDDAQLLFTEDIETQLLSGTGRAYGLEMQVQKKKGRLTGWIGYTLSRSERKVEGINNSKYYPANFDKTHDFSITGIYDLTKRMTFSANFVYSTGRPVTYPSGRYSYSGLVVGNYSQRNKDRMPDYHRLDFALTLKSKPEKKRESQWIFSVYNVYNRLNASSINFQEQQSDLQGRATATGVSEAVKLSYFGAVPGITYEIKF